MKCTSSFIKSTLNFLAFWTLAIVIISWPFDNNDISWGIISVFIALFFYCDVIREYSYSYRFANGWLIHEQHTKQQQKVYISDYTWRIEREHICFDNNKLPRIAYRSKLWYWILHELQEHNATISSDWEDAKHEHAPDAKPTIT